MGYNACRPDRSIYQVYKTTSSRWQLHSKNSSLTCMEIIDPAIGWFGIVEIPMFDLEEVTIGNDEYIDKSSSRVSHLFNNTCLCRYPRPLKVVFENGSEFK